MGTTLIAALAAALGLSGALVFTLARRRPAPAEAGPGGGLVHKGKRIAPGPPGQFLLGNMRPFLTRGPAFFQEAWKNHGDVLRFNVGPVLFHVLARAEHMHHVLIGRRQNYVKGSIFKRFRSLTGTGLLTSEGELWQRQRRLLQPTFTPKAVEQFVAPIAETTERMVGRWTELAAKGEPLDIHQEMTRLAMDIIGRTTLSVGIDAESEALGRAVEYLLIAIGDRTVALVDLPLFIPVPSNLRFRRELRTVERFIQRTVALRRNSPATQKDLLDLLLKARHEDSGHAMSERQIRDEVFTVFLAGHETTALTLFWIWRMLAHHPEAERRMKAELDQVLGGRAPTAADLPKLAYTGQVIMESMRLYPPIWVMGRDVVEDDEIGGYHIPGGSKIILCPLLTHRHPDLWEDPDAFDPDRFTPERIQGRPRTAHLPFGAGPRACVGNHFAMAEIQVVLAVLAQRFRLTELPGSSFELAPTTTLRARDLVKMVAHPQS